MKLKAFVRNEVQHGDIVRIGIFECPVCGKLEEKNFFSGTELATCSSECHEKISHKAYIHRDGKFVPLRGVCCENGEIRAKVTVGEKTIDLGKYGFVETAARVYDCYVLQHGLPHPINNLDHINFSEGKLYDEHGNVEPDYREIVEQASVYDKDGEVKPKYCRMVKAMKERR